MSSGQRRYSAIVRAKSVKLVVRGVCFSASSSPVTQNRGWQMCSNFVRYAQRRGGVHVRSMREWGQLRENCTATMGVVCWSVPLAYCNSENGANHPLLLQLFILTWRRMAKSKSCHAKTRSAVRSQWVCGIMSAAPKVPEQATRVLGQVDAELLSIIRSPFYSHRLMGPWCIQLDRQAIRVRTYAR